LEHNYPHLVRSAVVVVSNIANVKASHAVQTLHEDFERAVRAVHAVPYDPHLHEAAAIRTDRLKPGTRRAFVEAAASVADGFAAASDKDARRPQ
jgi:MinD-like ATPase involved in chromosome partitioning or flagellar assembly